MDLSNQRDINRDEIDLLALLDRSFAFLKRYKWLFLTGTLTGLFLGFLRFNSLPAVYKSRLVLQSSFTTNQNNIQIVSNWNNLLRNGNDESLAGILNIPVGLLQKVKGLKAEEIQKIFSAQNPNGFLIDVSVTDPAILSELQKGIVFGFDNHGVAKERLTSKRNRTEAMISKTACEIQTLDSLRAVIAGLLKTNSTNNSLIVDVQGISQQLIEMNEKHLGYKEELKFMRAVQVVQDFYPPKKPAGNSLIVWLVLGLLSTLSISFVIALIYSVNQKLRIYKRGKS